MVSIVVPTYNERKNIGELLERIHSSLIKKYRDYKIIVIDDRSTDGTWVSLEKLKKKFPLKIFKKEGKKGKAFSLVEGFAKSGGQILVMIDADLQYPPEAIPQMVKALKEQDIIVANRSQYLHSKTRKILSRVFKFAFGKLLFGQDVDIQSGLKVFKRRVWQTIKFQPASPWTFDLEFLHRAKHAGFKIASHDITFDYRKNGHSKIEVAKTGLELTKHAILLKFKKIHPQHLAPTQENSMVGAGVGYRQKQYITHTTLHYSQSAIKTVTLWQKTLIFAFALVLVSALLIDAKTAAITLIGLLTTIYFADVLFNAYLITRSLNKSPDISFTDDELSSIDDSRLPLYTILCPLYKEARVLRQFAQGIEDLDWPKDKLEVLLLLEEDDKETQDAARFLHLPSYFKTVIVPLSNPKTKPKACNWGLNYARGKYIVIFDAEDKPESLQLKKAYLAFEKFGGKVTCFQAKLNYYNTHHNLLTKFFTAEYSLWFGLILTGLQSLDTTIPLGGTSNHFKTETLRKLEGWDPFNVTEDCDLGVRLFKDGYQTAIIDSTTLEEANSKIGNWLRQRSRWIKGYMQTFLVHNRDFGKFVKNHKHHSAIFQLVVGGKIAFIMINPFMWLTTIFYFVFRASLGPTIEQFFPGVIFYMAAFCLVAGNFLYLYYYMIAVVKHEKFNLVKYVLFIPIYWAMISTAFWIAAYQLIFKPHYWEKTVHGFHLAKAKSDLAEIEKDQLQAEINAQKAQARAARTRKLRELIGSGTAAGAALIAAAIIGNFLNFLYNAYLGRSISVEEFGLISLIGSFILFSSVILGSLARTVTHKTAYFLGEYNTAFKQFWSKTRKRASLVALAVTAVWLISLPLLSAIFKTKSIEPFLLFTPVWLITILASVDRGFLSGSLRFKFLAAIVVLEAVLKLIFTIALVETGNTRFIYGAIPASMSVSFLIAWAYASLLKSKPVEIKGKNDIIFPFAFFTTSVFRSISVIAFISLDVILAKIFLSPTAAGQYALIALVGKMIFLVGGLFNQFINPLVSREEGAGRISRRIFYKLFAASTATSFLVYLAVGVFGSFTAPLLLGDKINPLIGFLPLYGLGIFCFTAANAIVSYYQIRKDYLFPTIGLLITIVQVLGIVFYHTSISQIVWVMTAAGIASLVAALVLHFSYRFLTVFRRGLRDFAGLFAAVPQERQATINLKVLIFNWRDTRHVWSGGAEVYIHEIAKRLVKHGHQVTLFCGNDGKCPRSETIDGVEIVRRGGNYLVYLWAFLYYIFKFRGKYDVIIDSENGVPFFTPLFCRKPVIGLIHHIHLKEVYRRHLPLPFADLAQFLETKVMPFVYRNKRMVTVSNSSKQEMGKIGFGKKFPIEVVNPGVDLSIFKPSTKSPGPSILYLGRLKPYKSVDSLIKVMKDIRKQVPKATLTIAGEGESRSDLENLVDQLGLRGVVQFLGKVSEKAKVELFGKAWVVAQPSKSEGWGLTVIEANACATPVVASDIPGLRDSLKNPHSGILVAWDNLEKWKAELTRVLKDKEHRDSLSKYAFKWSRHFSWEKSTDKFLKVIQEKQHES